MKKIFALAALAAIAVSASAQVPSPLGSSGLSARVGGFFPTDAGTRALSRTWFAAGVQYKLGDFGGGFLTSRLTGTYALSLDYFQRDDFRVLPIMLNYVGSVDSLFFTVGAGVSFTRSPANGGGFNDQGRFGYTLGVGYNVNIATIPAFVEGRFWGNERSEANGFGLYAGIHF
ncbi:hypothetical protein BH11ARM2_BH11ARM2_26180 [soil metagenome]